MDRILRVAGDESQLPLTVNVQKAFLNGDEVLTWKLFKALVADGYMKQVFVNSDMFEITGNGLIFIEQGGYTGQLTSQKVLFEHSHQAIWFAKWGLILTTIFSFISLVISILGYIKS